MDEIELEARRTARGPYNIVPQQDSTIHPPPVYEDEIIPETSGNISQLRPSNSMSKSLLAKVESLNSSSKLPPKSFIHAPTSKRIWIHIATATSALLIFAIPFAISLPVSRTNLFSPVDEPGDTYCTIHNLDSTNSTSFSSFFDVDTAFGTLSFGMAKFIDLIWDIGFSRCGQATLGWITYRVNTSALLRIMETQPVSYELFSALSLSWTSIASFVPVIKALFRQPGFRKKLILVWIVLNIFWVAFWPTITNAMTGYIAENNTLVRLEGEDGYVNYTDISNSSNLAFQFYKLTTNGTLSSTSSAPIGPIFLGTGPNITLWSKLSQMAQDRGNFAYIDYNRTAINDEYAEVFYYYGNQKYSQDYFQNATNVQCVATGVYQWGFASLATGLFAILNSIWSIGTYGVWIHMNRKSALCKKGRRLGTHRAAIDMVESIYQDLGKNICAYSEQELKEELKRKGGIKYYVEHGEGDTPSHIGITSSKDKAPVSLRFGELYGHL